MMENVKNVPALRFPEYEDIWREVNLGDAFSIFNGYAFSSNIAAEYGVRWVKIADVGIQVMKDDSLSYLPPEMATKHPKFILKEGDYVLALTRPILNGKLKIAMIGDDFAGALLNQRVGKIVTKNVPSFIYNLLQKESLIKTIEDNISGSDPPNLAPGAINSIPISIPSLSEQQKIASFLTAVDDKIQQLSKKKVSLEQYKKGVMQQLFSQKLRFKDDQGNEYPDWEEKTLIEVAKFRRGSFPQPYGLEKWYDEENGTPFVQVYDVAENFQLKPTTKSKISDLAKPMSVFVKAGTIVLTIQGSIGRIALTQYDSYVDRTLLIFESFKVTMNPKFFVFAVYLIFQIEKEKAPGGTLKTITKEVLSQFLVRFPGIEEQSKIASFLSAIDDRINRVNQQVEHTKQFKKGLLQQMFV